ncbi:hypothetical protein BDP27DRAFT_1472259, partial [Rhodocollybia butyracea]
EWENICLIYFTTKSVPTLSFNQLDEKPQRPVKYQLGTFLIRYGMLGSDSLDTALKLNIGHGTVFLYCHRVTRAIREPKSSYIGFPCFEDLQENK